ncbi:MAG TPA: peptidase [Gammaproteobacteria bacterium]|nr:peptidase [Gammaproteobacteria bacterium]
MMLRRFLSRPFSKTTLLFGVVTLALSVSIKADLADVESEVHGYHAFGFSEIAIIAGFRAHGHRAYLDSLNTAKALDAAIDELGRKPSKKALAAARNAWIAARAPYSYSEVLRFIFPPIDHWDKSVNAWPLDEGLIDYLADNSEVSEDNPYGNLNIIASKKPLILGQTVDATEITPELLRDHLHELDSIESNVAIGYHAIEFLLWGQDNNGTGRGAGNRPWTDYSSNRCTNGNCDRRFDYLKSVSTLLLENLSDMERAWREDGEITEQIYLADQTEMIERITKGVITFLNAELISERLRLPLRLQDPEHEHDCFSDQTHASLYNNFLGIRMVMMGWYPGEESAEDAMLINLLPQYKENYNGLYYSEEALRTIYDAGEMATGSKQDTIRENATVGHFDEFLDPNNESGQALIKQAIKQLSILTSRLVSSSKKYSNNENTQ